MEHVVKRIAASRVKGYPRPSGRTLALEDLRPADILLSRGDTDISNAIVAADGGSYSHAAMWSGRGVIETALAGTGEHPFKGDRDVYRHRSMVASAGDAIVAAARGQLGQEYAYSELLLLGILFALGLRPCRPLCSVALDVLGGPSAKKLEEWLERGAREPAGRVCTELVAVSYRSPAEGKYTLRVLPREHRPVLAHESALGDEGAGADADAAAAHATSASCANLLARHGLPIALPIQGAAGHGTMGGWPTDSASVWDAPVFAVKKFFAGTVAVDAITGVGLGVVTPADFQFSPSLEYVGRVAPPAEPAS